MESLASIRRIYAYDCWANEEALRSLHQASERPRRAVQIMAHIISAESLWLDRLEQRQQRLEVWPEWDLETCARELDAVMPRWRSYLDACSTENMERDVSYTNSKGERWSSRGRDVLMHLFLHGAYHRGQIATLLGAAGQQAAYTDFIHAVRQGLIVGE